MSDVQDLTALQDEIKKATHQMRDYIAKSEQQKEERGAVLAETKETIEKWNDRIDQLEERIKEVKLAQARPTFATQVEEDQAYLRKQAFTKLLRAGGKADPTSVLTPEEVKLLSILDNSSAGYLAPTEFVNEIIKSVEEISPVRQAARVMTTSLTAVQIPRRTANAAASWVAESGTISEDTSLQYGLEEIKTHKLAVRVDVTDELLNDSAFDIERELRMEFAEALAQAEGAAFVTGNGVGKPEGLLTNADIASVNSLAAADITASGLIDLYYNQEGEYARNGAWMMKRSTIKAVRQLTDVDGQYLWQPGLQSGQPATLLGAPIFEAVDMPAIAASATPILFGDFRRAYRIVDRVGMQLLRDPFSASTSGQIRWIATKRLGAQVVDPNAVAKQLISA